MSRVRDDQAIYTAAMMLLAKHPDLSPAKAADLAIETYDATQDALHYQNQTHVPPIIGSIGTRTWDTETPAA